MKAILYVYLQEWLSFSKTTATTIVHGFNFFAYLFTLVGGIISDSYLGKFKTILYLSIVYCFGSIVMAVTSFPGVTGDPPHWWGCILGLALLAFGTGGIKPCVASFGGDQFHSSQAQMIALFFSIFYFSINAGSVLSMFITPLLKEKVHCFGQESCYPLAFGLPALLMLVATIIFVAGSRLYVRVAPGGNVIVKIVSVVWTALKEKRRAAAAYPIHWLEYATYAYPEELIKDVQSLFSVLVIFIPIPLFWMLYDQQASNWVDQAWKMDGKVSIFGWSFKVEPAQMQTWNAVLILVMIPLFEKGVYPLLRRMGIRFKSLNRILVGMLLALASFIIAGIIQFSVDQGTFSPHPHDPRIRICTANCVHMFAQIPQIIVLTSGEILVSITGLDFAYSQAPKTMKSVCQAAWLLTVAIGNLNVVIVNEINLLGRLGIDHLDAWNYFLYAAILGLGCILFYFLAKNYKYMEDRRIPEAIENTITHQE